MPLIPITVDPAPELVRQSNALTDSVDALVDSASEGNVEAVKALSTIYEDTRYKALITYMDDDELP